MAYTNPTKQQSKHIAYCKTQFYYNSCFKLRAGAEMADKEQDKFIFKGVKVTAEQAAFVQRIADRRFEGNFSMALRSILNEAHKDFELCKSMN